MPEDTEKLKLKAVDKTQTEQYQNNLRGFLHSLEKPNTDLKTAQRLYPNAFGIRSTSCPDQSPLLTGQEEIKARRNITKSSVNNSKGGTITR